MIRYGWPAALYGACLLPALYGAANRQQPTLTIVSPPDESYVSGAVPIRAAVTGVNVVEIVTFFVDGRQICAIAREPYECHWDAGSTVKDHQIRVVATLGGGGRLVKTVRTRDAGVTETVQVQIVQVTATVTDGHGHFVQGLPKTAFRVFEDKKLQPLTHFAFEDQPPEIIVAIDVSSSLSESLPKLKAAVTQLLTAIPPNVGVTLLGFNDSLFTLARREKDPAVRAAAVERLAPWGNTALYDVIIRAVDLLDSQNGRKALLVFSDGEDTASRATIDDVERKLQETDAVLYTVGQGRGVSLDKLKTVLNRLSRPTGGRTLLTEHVDELKEAFQKILEELSNQYLLGYEPPNPATQGVWHEIRVEVTGGHEVRARHGYRSGPR